MHVIFNHMMAFDTDELQIVVGRPLYEFIVYTGWYHWIDGRTQDDLLLRMSLGVGTDLAPFWGQGGEIISKDGKQHFYAHSLQVHGQQSNCMLMYETLIF